ncbi:acetyltransferase [Cytobacillus oceanisediminis]|uniref:acetyltransferase n=1 Tax=Cytobacillus oceanisediminis TaxID=665099 RepID=UPI001D154EA9|nr:acetyltransferase [Cytobacillus oceanisediminis]MCC3648456.1 acetyltransferase [Cytobacillus oceanisediminis]
MKKEEIYIVGAGTYGEVMYELAEVLGYTVKGFYDEDDQKKGKTMMNSEVLCKFSELDEHDIKDKQFIIAIGKNSTRNELMEKINKFGGETPTLIHPSAIISPSADIGKGVYIHANAYIWTKVKIDNYSIISPKVIIAHHSSVGRACLISTMSAVGASVIIENEVFIGMGSTIMTGVSCIGENTTIGAGSVVIKDVDKNSVYAGVPAKRLRSI